MKEFLRYIYCFLGTMVFVIAIMVLCDWYTKKTINLDKYDKTIKELRDSLDYHIRMYDSIINKQNFIIDSLTDIEQKTIVVYEKAESDFNDSNIISDDSIIKYIAKKIQD